MNISELEDWIKQNIKVNSIRDTKVKIHETSNNLEITIAQMYEYVNIDFKFLKQLSEIVGSDEINDKRFCIDGCETCDHGSNYEITLTVKNHKLHI